MRTFIAFALHFAALLASSPARADCEFQLAGINGERHKIASGACLTYLKRNMEVVILRNAVSVFKCNSVEPLVQIYPTSDHRFDDLAQTCIQWGSSGFVTDDNGVEQKFHRNDGGR